MSAPPDERRVACGAVALIVLFFIVLILADLVDAALHPRRGH